MINVDYFYIQECQDSISIEDEGNCYLQVCNDDGMSWYLSVYTSLGWSTVIQMGPFTPDDKPDKYSFNFNRICTQYNTNKLYKTISNFVNDPKKCVTQAMEIELQEFIELLERVKFLGVNNGNE